MISRERLAALTLGILLASSSASAATRMIFPRVVFQNQRSVGFAIANPTGTQATVTLKAYNLDGSLFAGTGVTNPATRTVAAGAQFAEIASQVFTPPASLLSSSSPTRLWVEVTSPTDGLTGFFLEFNDSVDFIDGTDIRPPSTDVVVPLVENVSPSTTEVLIVNPNGADASLSVDLITAAGGFVAKERGVTVPKMGALQGPISGFLDYDYQTVAAMRVRSNVPIVCYADVFRQSDTSFITVPGMEAATPAKVLYFPQLAEGDGWATLVGVANLSGTKKVLATFTAYDSDGNLFALPQMENPVTREVAANGVFRADARSLFKFPSSPLQQGWLKVEASDATLTGYVEYSAGKNRALVAAQVTPLQASSFSHQANGVPVSATDNFFTGIAVLNPGSVATSYQIVSLDKDGRVNGTAQRVLKPGQKEARLIQQLIPAANGKAGGTVFLKADRPVIATQLFGTDSFSALANVPPQAVPASFDPVGSRITVNPPLAVVETGKSQTFSVTGGSGLIWQVEGSTGNDTVGRISPAGVYTAPASSPARKAITIQATTAAGDRSGGATIDVVQRETLTGGLTLLSSVAYIENLSRFFIAEQLVLSGPAGGRAATNNSAKISEVPPGGGSATQFIPPITNDVIAKMVPFVDGTSTYLLLAGVESGKIYRLNVATKQLATVTSGLNRPNSMVVDPISGDLFVSESGANQIITVPRTQILAAAEPGIWRAAGDRPPRHQAGIQVASPRGVAVDSCSGNVFFTQGDGSLREFETSQSGSRIVASNLNGPGQILPLYRDGLPCREALTLAVVEQNRVSLVYPSSGAVQPLVASTLSPVDLTFFPKGNPFTGGEASLGFAESTSGASASRVSGVPLGGIYQAVAPVTRPAPTVAGATVVPYDDPEGDTITTSLSTGLAVHDILSVNAHRMGGSVVITVRLKDPAVPLTEANEPNGVYCFMFVDQQPGGIGGGYNSPDPALFNPLRLIEELGWESFIDATEGIMFSLSQFTEIPISVTFSGSVFSVSIPESALQPTAKIMVIVANLEEATDVAPNGGAIQLFP